jgi:hypothetical protein
MIEKDEERLPCWACGGLGYLTQRCVRCDNDSSDCECAEPVLWDHMVCRTCGATW